LIAIRNEYLKYEAYVTATMQRLVTRKIMSKKGGGGGGMKHEYVRYWPIIYSAYMYVRECRIMELRTDVIYKT
jgi:hypothetical protein